jgi:hypothetical protein
MMTKSSEFIAFRPGNLAAEFAKRWPGQSSIAAKTLLSQTFAMLEAEKRLVRLAFSPAEIQTIVTALYNKCDEWPLIVHVLSEATKANSLVVEIARRFHVDTAALIGKLQALNPGTLFAIYDGVTQLRCLPVHEAIGPNGFPSLAALRRLGLLEVQGAPAWGLCVVRLADFSASEWVLRRSPADLGLTFSSHPVEDLAKSLVAFEHAMRSGDVDPDRDAAGYGLAYSVAIQKSWRHFRVEEDKDGCVVVREISRASILEDIHNGSLTGLVLEGVNAPDADSGFLAPTTTKSPLKAKARRPRKRGPQHPS